MAIDNGPNVSGEWDISSIVAKASTTVGMTSGVLTLALGAWQIGTDVKRRQDEKKEYNESMNSALDSNVTFEQAIVREDFKNEILKKTYRKNLDTEAIAYDVAGLMNTGKFSTPEDAVDFSILMRKFINLADPNESIEIVNKRMTDMIGMMNKNGDVSKFLGKGVNEVIREHFNLSDESGYFGSNLITYLGDNEIESEIIKNFDTLYFSPGAIKKLNKKQDKYKNRTADSGFSGTRDAVGRNIWYGVDGKMTFVDPYADNIRNPIITIEMIDEVPTITAYGKVLTPDDKKFEYFFNKVIYLYNNEAKRKIIEDYKIEQKQFTPSDKFEENIISINQEDEIGRVKQIEIFENSSIFNIVAQEMLKKLFDSDSIYNKIIFPSPMFQRPILMNSSSIENSRYGIMQQSTASATSGFNGNIFSGDIFHILDPIQVQASEHNAEVLSEMNYIIDTKVATQIAASEQRIVNSLREDYKKYGVASHGDIIGSITRGVKDTARIMPSVMPHYR